MSKPGLTGTTQSRTIEALQKALDRTYREMLKAAQEDWQLLFGGQDPANTSITVRISKTGVARDRVNFQLRNSLPRN